MRHLTLKKGLQVGQQVLGVNARLRWIPTAGQEGLIVLNHSLQDRNKDNAFVSELNDVAVKLSYTFRF